mgnify:CR=1 FL=1
MNEQEIANKIAEMVLKETDFWVALIGFIGVIVGALISIGGNVFLHWYQNRRGSEIDNARKRLLREMLDNQGFKDGRSLETLSKTICISSQNLSPILH